MFVNTSIALILLFPSSNVLNLTQALPKSFYFIDSIVSYLLMLLSMQIELLGIAVFGQALENYFINIIIKKTLIQIITNKNLLREF